MKFQMACDSEENIDFKVYRYIHCSLKGTSENLIEINHFLEQSRA